jgi:hypothetical protein
MWTGLLLLGRIDLMIDKPIPSQISDFKQYLKIEKLFAKDN